VAGAQPAHVVGDGALDVIVRLVAGVLVQAADVEAEITAGALGVAALGQVDLGGGSLRAGRRR
jgi:hypothetical protein